MTDPIPCPTCNSLLRLPAGANLARCPKCKTIVTAPTAAEPEPASPVGPAAEPTAPVAAPLPFQKAKAHQPIASPVARPVVPKPVVPSVAPNKSSRSPYDHKPAEVPTTENLEEKRRQVRKELRRLEQEKEDQAEWLAELVVLCQRGRTSMHLITWAVRSYLFAVLLQMVALLGAAAGVFAVASLGILLCGLFGILTSVLFMVGFGFTIAGPKEVRHIGVMGLVVTIFHMILGLLQPGNLAIIAGFQGLEEGSDTKWHNFILVQDILGIATDFVLLADHPARFMHRYNFSIPGLLVAAAEFTRLVLFSMLAMGYARGGKHPELGHTCMNAINRIFWIVLMTASFRLATSAAFDNLNPGDMMANIGIGVHWALTIGAYVALMVLLLIQSQFLSDTIDVIDYRYWADKRERLDML